MKNWFKSQIYPSDSFTPSNMCELEQYRRSMLNEQKSRKVSAAFIGFLIILFIFLIIFFFLSFFSKNTFEQEIVSLLLGLGSIMISGLYYWAVKIPTLNYQHAYRNFHSISLAETLNVAGFEFKKGKIPKSLIWDSLVVPCAHYSSNFHICMKYRDIDLIVAYAICDSDSGKYDFKGTFAYIEFPKEKFLKRTFVTEDKNKWEERKKEKLFNVKKVNLVDPAFEGQFDVFSEGQVEARYLVNPAFMEIFRSISYNHHPLSISFYDQRKVFTLIPNLELHLEPDILFPADFNASLVKKSENSLRHLLNLIDNILPIEIMRDH